MYGVMKLPLPSKALPQDDEEDDEEMAPAAATCRAPAYGARVSSGFVPRAPEDFGDGGAYPEIHVAQYPHGLGKKDNQGGSQQVALQVGGDGKIRYDAIVKQGENASRHVFSRYEDMVEKDLGLDELARPSDAEVSKITDKTRDALQALMTGKVANKKSSHALKRPNQDPTYIKYTPSTANGAHAGGAKHRVIRMVEVQQDPFEPPKFQRKKVPGGPPSPPVPVMHSPPRKVSAADQAAWKIPPCVSNWKNSKGYTRPLDKLLAADGRGLQDPQINDNFAKVSEALYIAERVAREEVEQRASMEKLRNTKKKEHKEEELREMAEKLRNERTRGMIEDEDEDDDGDDDLALRDEIRDERRRERERDRRLEAAGKKTKLSRDRDRDVSEQIALGMTTKTSEDLQYDQRLFNQTAGMDSGFAEEDAYNIYDKPLMKGTSSSMLYKPNKGDDEQYGEEKAQEDYDKLTKSNRFQPDKGFEGAEGGDRGSKRPRDNPVEFEKQEADPFGLDQFLSEAKKGKKAMDKIATGNKGHGSMSAGAGGSSGDYGSGSGRSKVEFDRR
jgi:SNW domain-containing protein 1